MVSKLPRKSDKSLPITCQPTLKQQSTSCLETLYGISPEIKIRNSFYETWTTQRQDEIDMFLKQHQKESNKTEDISEKELNKTGNDLEYGDNDNKRVELLDQEEQLEQDLQILGEMEM
tara:strand:- start:4562 stop:4915 length:354 start_codon:yes stop_codon:yes gene_type:complete